jgi:predicted Fe-S protein YdhL (DUF1289 family)
MQSPCIQYCFYNYDDDLCMGCGRNYEEINDWTKYSDQQREEKMKQCKKRLNIVYGKSSKK